MRLFLLLALMLRLAPMPVWDGHCQEAAPAAAGAHHSEPGTDADHGDCEHCPPSECAANAGCAGTPATIAHVPTVVPQFAAPLARNSTVVVESWQSVAPSPPTPPPVIHSA